MPPEKGKNSFGFEETCDLATSFELHVTKKNKTVLYSHGNLPLYKWQTQ
jgi:hypothetical protein